MRRFLIVLAILAGVLMAPAAAQADRPSAPGSSQNCTPLGAPVVCLYISGSGLHVDSFEVAALFSRQVPAGSAVKGYWRVRNGPGGPIVAQSKFTTYTVQGGRWYSWTFPVNKTYANPWTACGQFYDTVPGGEFNTYQPCGNIHALAGQRPSEAVFDVLSFTATPVGNGAVVFEATIQNLTTDTWRLAVSFDVLGFDKYGPTPQKGFLTDHEITTVQFHYRPPLPGHYTVVLGAWGKSDTASWSEWAAASAGFTVE